MAIPPDERELGRDPTWPCKRWGFEREDTPELTPAAVALYDLEGRLADVRKLLFHASRTRCPARGEVKALADLARDIHHRVLRELVGESRA